MKIMNIFKKEQPNWAVRNAMAGCWATINSKVSTHDQKIAAWDFLIDNVEEALKER